MCHEADSVGSVESAFKSLVGKEQCNFINNLDREQAVQSLWICKWHVLQISNNGLDEMESRKCIPYRYIATRFVSEVHRSWFDREY